MRSRPFVSLSELGATEASMDEEMSKAGIYGILNGYYPHWKMYHSRKDEGVYNLAETFVNRHAMLRMGGESVYSPTPYHVMRMHSKEKVDGVEVEVLTEGVIYSNGAVILVYRPDGVLTILLVDQETMGHFDYPLPS